MQTNHQNFPERVDQLFTEILTIKKMLEKAKPQQDDSKTLSLDKAIKLMSTYGCELSKSSVYKLTSASSIPFRKFGRQLLFDRDEIIQWCKSKISELNLENKVNINLAATANKKLNHGK